MNSIGDLFPSVTRESLSAARTSVEQLLGEIERLREADSRVRLAAHANIEMSAVVEKVITEIRLAKESLLKSLNTAKQNASQAVLLALQVARGTDLVAIRMGGRLVATHHEAAILAGDHACLLECPPLAFDMKPQQLLAHLRARVDAVGVELVETLQLDQIRIGIAQEWGIAARLLSTAGKSPEFGQSTSEATAEIPSWDHESGVFSFGDASCEIAKQAANMRPVLDRFESENWPEIIRSPFEEPTPHRNSIFALKQKSIVDFQSAWQGTGIRWRPITRAARTETT